VPVVRAPLLALGKRLGRCRARDQHDHEDAAPHRGIVAAPVATTDDLEQALAEAWPHADLEALSVYADHLLEVGDPRGELVALDLEIARRDTQVRQQRKRARVAAWLLADPAGFAATTFSFGFVETTGRDLAGILASPAGRYVRAVHVPDRLDGVALAVERLAAAPRPHLVRISIISTTGPRRPRDHAVEPARAAALVAATPRLHTLSVIGRRVFAELPHPAIRALAVSGHDAIGTLLEPGAPFAAVTALDYALSARPGPDAQFGASALASLLPAASLPALRVLDLRRNEEHREWSRSRVVMHELVGDLGVLPQLERLVVPSVCNEREAGALQTALVRARALRGLRIGGPPSPLTAGLITRAQIEVPPWPADPTTWSQRLVVKGARDEIYVPLDAAIHLMEERFGELPDAARAAWTALWQLVDALPVEDRDEDPEIRLPFDRATLAAALAIPELPESWARLRALLEADVTLRRIWE
jgi:hypothetical protein